MYSNISCIHCHANDESLFLRTLTLILLLLRPLANMAAFSIKNVVVNTTSNLASIDF